MLGGVAMVLLLATGGSSLLAEPPLQAETAEETSPDTLAVLWDKVRTQGVSLDASSEKAYLRSLLEELQIPVESQVLVFSKTSLQKPLIGPKRPRAIYFNEECYVGTVPGGDLEIISVSPERGFRYYLMAHPLSRHTEPELVQNNQCLSCHTGGELMVQSVHVSESGYPIGGVDRYLTSYESPFSERWGGWYVTGTHGADLHMGNAFSEKVGRGVTHDHAKGANITSLETFFQTKPYLTDTSDIVALMVLEHQYVMHNTLVDAAGAVRRWMARGADGTRVNTPEETRRVLAKHAQNIVRRLLFCDEYALSADGVTGSPAFLEGFRRNKKTCSDGTSLKDFDLKSRLFTHRCSYMIYASSFTGLPENLKLEVFGQLRRVLREEDKTGMYDHLPAAERRQILKILEETVPGFRDPQR